MTKLKPFTSLLFFYLFSITLLAQQIIHLDNPSFETISKENGSKTWLNCADDIEQKPDIQPNGAFGVMTPASEGWNYISLVTRDNNTTQAIGQRLSATMEAQKCYDFSLILAQSEHYTNLSRRTGADADYAHAVKLRIWGGNANCERTEFLGETVLVEHNNWEDYVFNFAPQEDLNYIILEAHYKEPNLFPYNGHVLVDDASPIVKVPCNSTETTDLNNFYKNEIGNIIIENSSFETTILDETKARFWKTCDEDQDLMTIEPVASTHQMPVPHDGINYISLKTDDNSLKGAINKNLKPYLQAQQCYRFSFWAARANLLLGESPYIKKQQVNFEGLAKIKVWGSQTSCEQGDLLAETPLITHQDWKKYEFILQPNRSYAHLKIEATYETPIQFFYNGHVLLDDLSDIELLNYDSLEYYYENLTFPTPEPQNNISETTKQDWKNATEKPKNKSYQSYTYSVRDSETSINDNLEKLLNQAYPDYVLLFNIFAPTKEDGAFQEDLLVKELERLRYSKHWYKTKIYLED